MFHSLEIDWTRPAKKFEIWCYFAGMRKGNKRYISGKKGWWLAAKETKNNKKKWKKKIK
jgi:hypothetical protein